MTFPDYDPDLCGYGFRRDGVPVLLSLDDRSGQIMSRWTSREIIRNRFGFEIDVVGFTNDCDAYNFLLKHGDSVFCVTTDHYRPESFYDTHVVDDHIAIPRWTYPTSFGFFMAAVNELAPDARWMRVTQQPRLVDLQAFDAWRRRDERILGDHNMMQLQAITEDILRAYLTWTLRRSRYGISTELRALGDAQAAITASWTAACQRGLRRSEACPALITSELHAQGFKTSEVLLRMSGHRVLALLEAPSLATGCAIVEIIEANGDLPPRLALVREFEGGDPAAGGWCWIATSRRSPQADTELRQGVHRVVRKANDWAYARTLIADVLASRSATSATA